MRQSGYKITEETIAFIQPGVTSRTEVIENLGPPLLELKEPKEPHVVAYSWGKMRVSGVKPSTREDPMVQATESQRMGYQVAPPLGEPAQLIETQRWICCIALDDKDRVTRVERVEVSGAGSLEQAVRGWAAKAP